MSNNYSARLFDRGSLEMLSRDTEPSPWLVCIDLSFPPHLHRLVGL